MRLPHYNITELLPQTLSNRDHEAPNESISRGSSWNQLALGGNRLRNEGQTLTKQLLVLNPQYNGILVYSDPKDHISITILGSGSKAKDKGIPETKWF